MYRTFDKPILIRSLKFGTQPYSNNLRSNDTLVNFCCLKITFLIGLSYRLIPFITFFRLIRHRIKSIFFNLFKPFKDYRLLWHFCFLLHGVIKLLHRFGRLKFKWLQVFLPELAEISILCAFYISIHLDTAILLSISYYYLSAFITDSTMHVLIVFNTLFW